MYNLEDGENPGGSYIKESGIHKGIKITNIEFEEISEKVMDKQIIISFENDQGEMFRHVEFEQNPAKLRELVKSWGVKQADQQKTITDMMKNQMQKIYHILSSFMPKEAVGAIKANDWTGLGKAIVRNAGTMYQGETFQIKLVYDKKGNLTFPRYVQGNGFVVNESTGIDIQILAKDVVVNPIAQGNFGSGLEDDDDAMTNTFDDSGDEGQSGMVADEPKTGTSSIPDSVTGEDDKEFDNAPAPKTEEVPEADPDEISVDDQDLSFLD